MLAGSVAFGGWYMFVRQGGKRPDLLKHTIVKEKLQVTITERGNVESAENNDISCRVKARAQGSQTASTIRSIVDDGSAVKKGDVVVELDDSALQDQLISQQIVVDKAKGDWDTAEEEYKITLSQNASDIATQKLNIEVGQLTLDEYLEGLYQQSRTDLVGKVTMARSDLAMWEERAAWSERMSRPGRGYVTSAQAEADHARLLSAQITLQGLEKQLDVLDKYTQKKTAKDLQGKIDEYKRALERVEAQAESKKKQADVKRITMKLTYEREKARYEDIEGEIKKCTIRAPQDGIVVYFADERQRGGGGQQSIIAQGEPVREGQKLMRIPDLNKMMVDTKVHEAMVSRVHGDDRLSSGNGKRRYNGQRASIRLNAFPNKVLKGHVKSVATVPSKQDWFSSDVKVYQTLVMIDEHLEGVKPGMDAQVTIYVDTHEEPVLTIPLEAVLGSADRGEKRKCFVDSPEGPKQREITLGLSNETKVEVVSGLEEGDVVILNPLVLLTEAEKREYDNQPVNLNRGGEGKGRQGKGDPRFGGPGGAGMQGGMPKDAGKGGWPKDGAKGGWPKDGKQIPPGGFPKDLKKGGGFPKQGQ
jgi:multidrug efflux pump subunit AcrA (membrane-fusion protein)